ncbi:filamentous hemagglutinin, partial [Escherichia coli]|nr:filamentous hemagglutinin [Escherichia coli]
VNSSDLIAGRDMALSGKEVSITAATDQHVQTHTVEQKTSGLTLALSGTAGSALNTTVETVQAAKSAGNSRLEALQGVKAALSGAQAVQAGRLADAQGADAGNNNTVGISLSYGSQSSKSEQQSEQTVAKGSTLTAGNNLSIQATGSGVKGVDGDLTIQGSQIKAGNNILLQANRDVNLVSAENTSKLEGKNTSSGGSVGVGVGVGSGGWGISVSASANQGKGSEKGNGTTHTETTVDAGNRLTIISGRDTTLTGAQAGGETVKVDAGRHLTLTSEQDSDRYDSKQQNASAGGSFTFGSMSGSASVNLSRDKMHSNYDSVQEQTGIFAGRGGFDVTTGQHTQLNGAVIASTATADKNRLDTGTLGFSDIENRADFKTEHQSAGLSTGGSVAGNFLGNMANNLLVGANHEGHADSTTQSAVSAGNITIRDTQSQKQDVADLKRDAAHANQTLSPIFDREKEQQRLQQAQLIGEIGNQVADIARTEGQIAGEKAKRDPAALNQARAELEAAGKPFTEQDVAQRAYNNGMAASGFGTGGKYQQAIQAATAAVQGLAGGNLSAALAGGAVPYIAEIIKQTTPDGAGRVAAHAVVNAALSLAQGKNALAGAAGAATGEVVGMIATQMYGKPVSELSETEKQTVSTLATVAAGLAGGLVGDSGASAVAGAQSGKTTVENNFLGTTSSDKLDKAVEKIKNGDKSLATANELIRLENADKRSDALVSKFTKDPSQMTSTERAELAAYLRVYASEMEKEYGTAVAQELVTGLLSGQDYIKRNPDTEAMAKAQSIMNTWGYHKSNASIGDAPLLFGGSVLGLTVKGMATNAAIGISVNSAAQLAGKDPFSYVDAIMAGVTAAATTGKGIIVSTPINMGGAAIGSSIKGEDPTNSVIGAGVGSIFGGGIGKIATEQLKPVIKEGSAEVIGAVTGAVSGEVTGNQVKDKLDKVGNKNGSN